MVKFFKVCFSNNSQGPTTYRFIKWNNNSISSIILNVDGGCLSSPIRAGYGRVLRNDTLMVLLTSCLLNYMLYTGVFCLLKTWILLTLFVTLICVNLIQGPSMKFHVYAVLIQEIKELISQINIIVCHTLREGNQCADFMVKLGASSNIEFLLQMTCCIPSSLMQLKLSFLEISFFFFFSFCCFCFV